MIILYADTWTCNDDYFIWPLFGIPFQVLTQKGEWIEAKNLQGSVLVNIGDILQRWSADKLKSTVRLAFSNLCGKIWGIKL